MHDIYLVLLKAFFWIEKRFRTLTSKPIGKVGLLVVLVLLGTTLATHPAYAAEPDWIDKTILWFAELALGIASFLATLVIKLIDAMLPVMTYNNFTNSPIVNAGWAIVRDTVNMFFVIVLIAIAFGTIFGASKFKWATQVPRLLIFAIVINFSKTLCGLMIDFGQVIMLTFANALTQIAAGNFVQLLGFTDIYAIGTNNSTYSAVQDGSGNGPATWSWFFAGLGAVVLMLGILGVMLILFAILVYRVIMLWILIVIAPLAWFIGGVSDLIKSEAYTQWWGRFKCLVVIGPVLTFFLWLTLAVAGAGNIALKSGFDVSAQGDLANPAGIINRIFEADRFLSLVIAIALLYAGFEAAQTMCSTMPGLKNLKGSAMGALKKAKGYGMVGAGYAAKPVIGTARLGLRGVGAGVKLAAPAASNLLQKNRGTALLTKQGRANAFRALERNSGTGMMGRGIGVMAGKLASGQEAKLSAANAAAGKGFENLSTDQKVALLNKFGKNPPTTQRGKQKAAALYQQLLGDKDATKALSDSGADKALWASLGGQMEVNARGDKGLREKMAAFKKTNPHLTGSAGTLKAEDYKNLSDDALANEAVRAQAGKLKAEYVDANGNVQTHRGIRDDGTEGELNVAQAMAAGKYGSAKQRAFASDPEAVKAAALNKRSDEELRMVSAETLAANGSETVLNRVADSAVGSGDLGRLETVLAQLVEQMKDPQKGFDAQAKFDNLVAHASQSASGKDAGMQARIETAVKRSQANRNTAMGMETLSKDGKFFQEHGTIPSLSGKPPTFLQNAFQNASEGRIKNGVSQLTAQQEALEGKKADTQSEVEKALSAARSKGPDPAVLASRQAELKGIEEEMTSIQRRKGGDINAYSSDPAYKKLLSDKEKISSDIGSLTPDPEKDEAVVNARKKVNDLTKEIEVITAGLGTLTGLMTAAEAKKNAPKPSAPTPEFTDEQLEATGQKSRVLGNLQRASDAVDAWGDRQVDKVSEKVSKIARSLPTESNRRKDIMEGKDE